MFFFFPFFLLKFVFLFFCVAKIQVAESLGAKGVIICDWKNEPLFQMWMPLGFTHSITIPSVLLQHDHCVKLMEHLGVNNWDPQIPQYMSYPSLTYIKLTIAEIEWGLPHHDGRVEYELWTASNDKESALFKKNFNSV